MLAIGELWSISFFTIRALVNCKVTTGVYFTRGQAAVTSAEVCKANTTGTSGIRVGGTLKTQR